MSELAYNINGEGFEPPETTTGWRVRRMKQRGAPEVVYGKDGLPLIIPIEADLAELRRHVDTAGRFRLDPVDDRGRNVEGAQPAYVVVPHKIDEDQPTASLTVARPAHESVVAEAMRLNTELAKSVIDRFPEMMTAAAELMRAADGAGIPARLPRAAEAEDEDDQDEAPLPPSSPGFEMINNLIAQVVPIIINGLASKKMKLSSVVDWQKAHADGVQEKQSTSVPALAVTAEEKVPSTASTVETLPALDPQMMAHFIAIQSALKPEEAALAREVASSLGGTELRAWFDELSKLSVAQAVQKIRVLIAGNTEAVS